MPRSTTSAVTEPPFRRLLAACLGFALTAQVVAAVALLDEPTPPRHVLRLVDAGGPSHLSARVAAEMPGAIAAVTTFWGDDWPAEIVVVTTGSDAEFAAAAARPARESAGLAAVAVADRVDLTASTASGQRIVLAPGAITTSDSALRIVLRHELFHYAARTVTAFDSPRWLTEGVADFVGRPAAAGPRSAVAARLPTDAELDAPGPAGSAAYDRAWWFATFVADSYGSPALRLLYRVACGDRHPDAAAAVREVLGLPLPDLLADWQRWMLA